MGLMRTDAHASERKIILEALANSLGPDGQQKFIIDLRLLNILYRGHEMLWSVSPCHVAAVRYVTRDLEAIEPPDHTYTRQNRIQRISHQAARIVFARYLHNVQPQDVEPLVEKALQYLEELRESNNESQYTQVGYSRLTPHHEERVMRWLKGRFRPGLRRVNYSLQMMRKYWEHLDLAGNEPS
ncbi:hypothetical protein CLAFUW4_14274 [Fulvia fulva]|uniref:Uncharacterized protein n=1 Tax=Passalora fulva TaxID=5499 RepID=A0A9Q8PM79_PASFU|nr:uncharacterized protein CLAFUR5_14107 [Fulvia fulva]KAK4609047.1 hypothetical protein CLAFUR4_14274 [Fulvia fulva]KAK4610036.1 hypothetical protein CLAFUR0_14278 [Fulvia fulva]UJO25003.1 hypothetical protein CLAFUR5_14107 [Fulvia fulva]WPV22651.1 hypothetical protein CLAFUW4_14274 [Fulvia fulva]WPV37426.1 hypothetical protein CLAFUW7_14282 [Fulvia fulva]